MTRNRSLALALIVACALSASAAEYGTRGIRQYVNALDDNSPAGDAALAAFGVPASDFDRAFQTYLRTRFNDR